MSEIYHTPNDLSTTTVPPRTKRSQPFPVKVFKTQIATIVSQIYQLRKEYRLATGNHKLDILRIGKEKRNTLEKLYNAERFWR